MSLAVGVKCLTDKGSREESHISWFWGLPKVIQYQMLSILRDDDVCRNLIFLRRWNARSFFTK